MTIIEQLQSKHAKANLIWRFYSDSDRQWRWEQLAFDGTVLDQSKSGYKLYESCLANAVERGYVLLPSLSTRPNSTTSRTKRSYVRASYR